MVWSLFKRRKDRGEDAGVSPSEQRARRYERPRILLIDLPPNVDRAIQDEGYDVASGSLGVPYRVPKQDMHGPVIPNGHLPGYLEREVVMVNLQPAQPLEKARGEKVTSPGEPDWWGSCSNGLIDPRARTAASASDGFDRILEAGGVFVVFTHPREIQKLTIAVIHHGMLLPGGQLNRSSWSFLSVLTEVDDEAFPDGREIRLAGQGVLPRPLLEDHLLAATFSCTIEPRVRSGFIPLAPDELTIAESWIPLAVNGFGAVVAAVIAPTKGRRGWVLLLPQVQDKPGFVVRLVKEGLPELAPELFPHVEGARWVERQEYELPRVARLQSRIRDLEAATRAEIARLRQEVKEERAASGYLHDLLRGTDRSLVTAVKQALEVMGFTSVVDVDEQLRAEGVSRENREDLQVLDHSPTLLTEVKGIAGCPSDEDALAAGKYLAARMHEWKRTDVQSLAIINHQRHVPGLDRDRAPFRELVVQSAEQQRIGLLTTWDLFRLVRSYGKLGWTHEQVRPLFYQTGRIEAVPPHYSYVGTVVRVWNKAAAAGVVGVQLESGYIRRGDRIAFELLVEFEEAEATSLRVNEQVVEIAEAPCGVGIGVLPPGVREGTRVFRVLVAPPPIQQEDEQVPAAPASSST